MSDPIHINDTATIYLLMKKRDPSPSYEQHPEDQPQASVHAAYTNIEALESRIERIANNPDNRRYQMTGNREQGWRIGPSEDQGFFGQQAMRFWVVEKDLLHA